MFSLAEAVAMVCEDDSIEEADLVVLPPTHVDDQSDCERCDEDDLMNTDDLPADVAGAVEVHYQSSDRHAESSRNEKQKRVKTAGRETARKRKRTETVDDSVVDDTLKSIREKENGGETSIVETLRNETQKRMKTGGRENTRKRKTTETVDETAVDDTMKSVRQKENGGETSTAESSRNNKQNQKKPDGRRITRKGEAMETIRQQESGVDTSTNKSASNTPCSLCDKSKDCKKTKEKPKPINTNWNKCNPKFRLHPVNVEKEKTSELTALLIQKTEVELFEEFWDGEMFDFVTKQSMLYAQQQNRHEFDVKNYKLKRFIGFLLFSGYHKLPRERMYWEKADDCSVGIVSEALSRQEYIDIKRNLHLANNAEIHSCDKFYKLRRYFDLLNERFAKFGVFSHNICVDEQMIPYFGRHSCKMYMKGKPVRFGFKTWCLCSSNGYLYNFMPYAGRDDNIDHDLGLGASVVVQLLDIVREPSHHAVYFDNFFTSQRLLLELSKRKFCATGTVRECRLVSCTLEDSKTLAKKDRGYFDWRYEKNSNIMAVKWNDNSVVTLTSNFETVHPLLTTKRFSRTAKKIVTVPQPNLIASYNSHMGGVDMLDNFVAKYRITIKGKKWWWPLFINFVDVALCNAWSLHRLVHGKELDLLEFRRRVAISLLKAEPDDNCSIIHNSNLHGRPSHLKNMFDPHHSRGEHYIKRNPDNRRIRCRLCKSTTYYICAECDVGIHAKCFAAYHCQDN